MHAKWVLLTGLFFAALTLQALDVSYGNFLKITDIKRTADGIFLPAERKEYHNIRILSKQTYQFVKRCQEPCVQDVLTVQVSAAEVRPAQTQPNMWIVSVALNQDWLLTTLVFGRKDKYEVRFPKQVRFLDPTLKKRVEESVISSVNKK